MRSVMSQSVDFFHFSPSSACSERREWHHVFVGNQRPDATALVLGTLTVRHVALRLKGRTKHVVSSGFYLKGDEGHDGSPN